MSRKKIAAGNWKMNKTAKEAVEFVQDLKEKVAGADTEVVAGVPFVCIPLVKKTVEGSNIKVAAQNMHWEENGAFTGEVSGPMLADLEVDYVIIGHSERRQYFAETDETVNKKAHAAFKYGLKPIICVGESLTQREQGITSELVRYQVKIALLGLSADQVKETVIAYEPIWAIGTGKTATSQQAQEVCAVIRKVVEELYGKDVAEAVRIQYGGSVKAANAAELFNMPDIDGGLVGGASLKLDEFEKIVNYNK
ncbi:triose-phosphate isomerase [Herbivorax sp. ANBcel31]|uniref:triose-phosphate isomerase n=1 Tax=Herbivorax sp. ANBcel31 TaxID=3069754 RepID=UPI0027B3EB89|nr:triose-phosphate isomerase [Herbivorax sp. ANBcel31]MDQ2086113.1 triose-phosphate isomerase [Herbivorax sp. ANBcel31]